MGLIEYKFTLSQYINQILLLTYVMFLLIVSLSAGLQKIHRSKPTSTSAMEFLSELFMWLGKCFYSTDSKYKQHYTVQQNMFMTQQSQRLWGHATVVAQARPPSHIYVHQYQRITLEEVVASSLAAPSLLSPHIPLVPDCSQGRAMRWKMGRGYWVLFFFFNASYMCFWTARVTSTTVDARALAPWCASSPQPASSPLLPQGQPCLHEELLELDFLDRLIMLGWNSVWRRACLVRWSLRMNRFSHRGHRNCFSPVWVR